MPADLIPRMPKTRAEWQDAVDWADFMLTVDACRQYGLIEGGPVPDVFRCEYILKLGRNRRIVPRPGHIEACLAALKAEEG